MKTRIEYELTNPLLRKKYADDDAPSYVTPYVVEATTGAFVVAHIVFRGTLAGEEVSGTSDSDHIKGESGDDIIHGEAGVDVLDGGKGADSVSGGTGNDTLWGGDGDDGLKGGVGDDVLRGGRGNDVIAGGLGNDDIFGDSGADLLVGGVGNDVIAGGDGMDEIFGGIGVNYVDGGDGMDVFHTGTGTDIITTGGGGDIIIMEGDTMLYDDYGYDSATSSYLYTNHFREGGYSFVVTDMSADDKLINETGEAIVYQAGVDYSEVPYLPGLGVGAKSSSNDARIDDTIIYYRDIFLTDDSGKFLLDDDGNKQNKLLAVLEDVSYSPTNIIHGTQVQEASGVGASGASGAIARARSDERDYLTGTGEADIIYGFSGNDELYGTAGNDIIYGGLGRDSLYGGGGDDVLDLDDDFRSHTKSGRSRDDASVQISVYDAASGSRLVFSKAYGEHGDGGSGDDIIYGSGGIDYIKGGDGDDMIYGYWGDDYLQGGGDENFINAGQGDDRIITGFGEDTVTTEEGDDIIELRLVDAEQRGHVYVTDFDASDRVLLTGDGDDTIYGFSQAHHMGDSASNDASILDTVISNDYNSVVLVLEDYTGDVVRLVEIHENHPLNKAVYDASGLGSGLTLAAGSHDNDLFTIDSEGKVWFKAIPDFEAPADGDDDNVYEIALTHESTITRIDFNVADIALEKQGAARIDHREMTEAEYKKSYSTWKSENKKIGKESGAQLFTLKRDAIPEELLPSHEAQHILNSHAWFMPLTGPLVLTWSLDTLPYLPRTSDKSYFVSHNGDDVTIDQDRVEAARAMVERSVAKFEAVANLKFIEVAYSEDGQHRSDITIHFDELGHDGGHQNVLTGGVTAGHDGAGVYQSIGTDSGFDKGAEKIFMHEFGHALRLHHPQEVVGIGKGNREYESSTNTIMSYTTFAHWKAAGKSSLELQSWDKEALQWLYGAPGTDFDGIENILDFKWSPVAGYRQRLDSYDVQVNENIDTDTAIFQLVDLFGVGFKDIELVSYLPGEDEVRDNALFTVDTETGEIRFKESPDFENPHDIHGGEKYANNNLYEVRAFVIAPDYTQYGTEIFIEVLDVVESTDII